MSEIILASASLRRKDLLAGAGYKFSVIPSSIEESVFNSQNIPPCEYARKLALAKATEVAQKNRSAVVIGADTVVDFDGQIIGKPCDAEDAERITRLLFSGPHKVITGVAIVRIEDGTEVVEADTTTIYPKKLSESELAEHIKSGNWRDKAGAYAIREGADEFIERIEGSLTNVMGLPMELVERVLERFAD